MMIEFLERRAELGVAISAEDEFAEPTDEGDKGGDGDDERRARGGGAGKGFGKADEEDVLVAIKS